MKRQSKPLCSYQNVEFRGKSLCGAAHVVLLLWLAGGLSACHKADGDAPYPRHLLWGDTHVHSKLSMDAHIYGNTHLGPDAAYRFAKGERVDLPGGGEAVLQRPLDFLVVADHAEYLGVQAGLNDGNPDLLETGRQHAAKPPRHAVKLPCHAARSRSIQKPPNRTTA